MPNSDINFQTHGPVTKWMRRKDDRPRELLDAALTLFDEKGYAETRVEEVAQKAGVSKGTLFLYFSSKEELFKEVVRTNISIHIPLWNEQVSDYQGSSAELLKLFMNRWWTQIGETKAAAIYKMIMTESNKFPQLVSFYQDEVVQPGEELIRQILQRGISNGEFRPLNVDYGVLSVIAPMLFLITWRKSMGAYSNRINIIPEQYIAAQIDNLLQGFLKPAHEFKVAKGF